MELYRSTSFRSNLQIRNNENILRPGKELVKAKIVNGPTVRRAVLGDLGNEASLLHRSVTDASKFKNAEPFKKPVLAAKTRAAAKRAALPVVQEKKVVTTIEPVVDNVDISNNNSTVVCEMHSITATEDMSVIEGTTPEAAAEEEQQQPAPDEDETVSKLSHAFSSTLISVTDIDAEDKDNPQLVSEYVNDIYAYMKSLELKHMVTRRYLDGHAVTPRMRTILVDWLVQVHMRFNLMQETLYLTIAMLDRYLQLMPDTPKDELQLVGVTAMFISSKYEEMYCSEISDYVYISDKAYTKQQIRRMEVSMLKKLGFYISYPLPLHFLRRNSKAAQVDGTQHTLAKYLMELCLPDYNMCHYKASEIGAAVLCLSMRLIGDQPEWTDTLVYYSGYSESDLSPIICKMAQCVTRSHTSNTQAIQQKYRASKHMKINELSQLRGPLIRSLSQKAASFS